MKAVHCNHEDVSLSASAADVQETNINVDPSEAQSEAQPESSCKSVNYYDLSASGFKVLDM